MRWFGGNWSINSQYSAILMPNFGCFWSVIIMTKMSWSLWIENIHKWRMSIYCTNFNMRYIVLQVIFVENVLTLVFYYVIESGTAPCPLPLLVT